MNDEKEKYWELVKIEMEQAYSEHQLTGGRALEVIKQWLIVIAFPFIVIGSLIAFVDKNEVYKLFTENWLLDVPMGIRPFFIFSGIMSFLLLMLHNSIDLHKMICRNAMNSFRLLHKTALKEEYDKLHWNYPIRTDLFTLKIDLRSNSFWFTLFGGGISSIYCLIGLNIKHPTILIIGFLFGSIVAIIITKFKFSFENIINGLRSNKSNTTIK